MNHPPLAVELVRGPAVESRHAVHAVIMDGQGALVAAYGDAARPTFARSSIKPLQAIALVESGAADAYKLSESELALACASHAGEEKHTSAVAAWLARLGLDESVLECGPHAPYAAPGRSGPDINSGAGTAPGAPPSVLCNNCSGKHAGMVTLALHMKVPPAGYVSPSHPAQQKILQAISEICGAPITPATCGIDGCSAPAPVLPLESLGAGFAAFMNPARLSLARGAACRRLFGAMTAHPDLVSGTGRLDTVLMTAARGKILSKGGAEGVYACLVPEKDRVLVLKAEDGAARAAQAALFALLDEHRLANPAVLETIRPLALPVQKNCRGLEVGVIRA